MRFKVENLELVNGGNIIPEAIRYIGSRFGGAYIISTELNTIFSSSQLSLPTKPLKTYDSTGIYINFLLKL